MKRDFEGGGLHTFRKELLDSLFQPKKPHENFGQLKRSIGRAESAIRAESGRLCRFIVEK